MITTADGWKYQTNSEPKYGAIWCEAWWRKEVGDPGDDKPCIVRIAPWYKDEAIRGKLSIRTTANGYNMNDPVPGNLVPYLFDSLDEAKAVYDLIKDKEE
jgi:hypothetical protein